MPLKVRFTASFQSPPPRSVGLSVPPPSDCWTDWAPRACWSRSKRSLSFRLIVLTMMRFPAPRVPMRQLREMAASRLLPIPRRPRDASSAGARRFGGMRRIAALAFLTLAGGAAGAHAQPADDACSAAAPSAAICIGAQKPVEAAGTTCRVDGGPEALCSASPYGHVVRPSELEAYGHSWAHRTARFEFALGDTLSLRDAQWLGTHNSFNADANGLTLSHADNNQQLTLTQQLDGDIRALELDVHFVPGTENGGQKVVRVCHGRGADEYHAGCTTEPLLTAVLPEIRSWLAAHPGQVVLLYLEDHLDEAAGYA